MTMLMSDLQETQEILNKHKTDSTVRHKIHLYSKNTQSTIDYIFYLLFYLLLLLLFFINLLM